MTVDDKYYELLSNIYLKKLILNLQLIKEAFAKNDIYFFGTLHLIFSKIQLYHLQPYHPSSLINECNKETTIYY